MMAWILPGVAVVVFLFVMMTIVELNDIRTARYEAAGAHLVTLPWLRWWLHRRGWTEKEQWMTPPSVRTSAEREAEVKPKPRSKARQTEVVIGYRGWNIYGNGYLMSCAQQCLWVPLARATADAVPALGGQKGLYAYNEQALIENFIGGSTPDRFYGQVFGSVSLWGTIAKHEHGYRAQYAYPRTFYGLKGMARLLKALAELYAVEYRIGETWEELFADLLTPEVRAVVEQRRKIDVLAGRVLDAYHNNLTPPQNVTVQIQAATNAPPPPPVAFYPYTLQYFGQQQRQQP
jgi:hypothetical protein